MKTFIDKDLAFTFNCLCGSEVFQRPEHFKNFKSFFEGGFECVDCKKEHDYTSTSFKRNHKQTELF